MNVKKTKSSKNFVLKITMSMTVAFIASTRDRSAKLHIMCFGCGRKGHYRSECPRAENGKGSDGKLDGGKKCHNVTTKKQHWQ